MTQNKMEAAANVLGTLADVPTTTIIYQLGGALVSIRPHNEGAWLVEARAGSEIPSEELLRESFTIPILITRLSEVQAIISKVKVTCPYNEQQND